MAEDYSVNAKLTANGSEFISTIDKMINSINSLKQTMNSLGDNVREATCAIK